MAKPLRIVFMGTPDFAVSSLEAINKSKHQIVGAVTTPDRKSGRGLVLQYSPVKNYALAHNIKLLQPEKLRNETFINELKLLKADLFVVVAFRMLPDLVWKIPPLGTINLHASLLPQYRGAAPINWAIINGETKTGVTTFFINEKIDTGAVLLNKEVTITEKETAGTLHDKLMEAGSKLLVETIDKLSKDELVPKQQQQEVSELKNAPKIFKENCKINWNNPSTTIYNKIRGLSPYPAAWTELKSPDNKTYGLKLFFSKISNKQLNIGEILIKENRIFVGCAVGSIEIVDLQLAGKKRMKTDDFLRGFKLTNKWTVI